MLNKPLNLNAERKVANRKAKEQHRGKFYYTEGETFSRNNGACPPSFTDKIICGDSEEILAKIPDNTIDLVFTSPPYNFGLEYKDNETDAKRWNDYYIKLFKILDECIRVLKYGGRLVINIQPLFSDYIPTHHIISKYLMDKKLIWKGEILWEKNNYNCKYTAWGSWKSPSNPYLKYTWEFVEVFCKGDLKKTGERENADISGDEFKKWTTAKWSIGPERKMKEFGHPAMFPEELAERVMKMFSFKGDIILDPFNGVGTTSVVARNLGRHYVGIDYSEEYCEKARKRLNLPLVEKKDKKVFDKEKQPKKINPLPFKIHDMEVEWKLQMGMGIDDHITPFHKQIIRKCLKSSPSKKLFKDDGESF